MSTYLGELASHYGTDKRPTEHGYTEIYSRYFSHIRNDVKSFLEIGVEYGKSLRMWHDYFPCAMITGFDLDVSPERVEPLSERVKLVKGDQGDVESLTQLKTNHGPFDIIVDDGGHFPVHQVLSFDTLFESVKPGGYYVIEDLQTQLCEGEWMGWATPGEMLTFNRLFKAVEDMQGHGAGHWANFSKDVESTLPFWERSVEYVHFYRYMAIIKRK